MNDLANRARALHRERGMTAEQIRHRSGFLDDNNDPYIPVATIRDWLGEEGAGVAPREASIPPTPRAVTPLDTIQRGGAATEWCPRLGRARNGPTVRA